MGDGRREAQHQLHFRDPEVLRDQPVLERDIVVERHLSSAATVSQRLAALPLG